MIEFGGQMFEMHWTDDFLSCGCERSGCDLLASCKDKRSRKLRTICMGIMSRHHFFKKKMEKS